MEHNAHHYQNGHVEHWLNGIKVVEFEEGSPEYEAAYKKSKWVDYPGWEQVEDRCTLSARSWRTCVFQKHQGQTSLIENLSDIKAL